MKITYFLLAIIILPTVTAVPELNNIVGATIDGGIVTVKGNNLGNHTMAIEWLGGKYGALESIPLGSKLGAVHVGHDNDPGWSIAPGWQTGSTVPEGNSLPFVDDLRSHSYDNSLRHQAGTDGIFDSFFSSSMYLPKDDPDPLVEDKFNEIFWSSWWYVEAVGSDSIGWKIIRLKHGLGTNGWEGDVRFYDTAIRIIPMDENNYECNFPCSAPLSCTSCALSPDVTSATQSDWERNIIDSYGTNTPPEWHYGKWMRFDWWIKASSDFDTWDGKMYFRNRIPDDNVNYLYRLENTATHGSELQFDLANETLVPPYWDLVWDVVQYINMMGPSGRISYDDQYIQFGTPARIELCENSNYEQSLHCEMQKPVEWKSDKIDFELNYGSFTETDTTYLFVFDDNNIPSEGLQVNLGEIPSEPYLSRVDGTFMNGDTLTLHGFNFGAHSLQIESSTGNIGWIESSNPGTAFGDVNFNTDIGSWEYARDSSFRNVFITDDDAYSGDNSILSFIGTNTDDPAKCNNDWCWQGAYSYTPGFEMESVYVSYYYKPVLIVEPPDPSTMNIANKMLRFNDHGGVGVDDGNEQYLGTRYSGAGYPGTLMSWVNYGYKGCGTFNYNYDPDITFVEPYRDLGQYPYFAMNELDHDGGQYIGGQAGAPQQDEWSRIEIYFKSSDYNTLNGELLQTIRKPNQERIDLLHMYDFATHHNLACMSDRFNTGISKWKYLAFQNYIECETCDWSRHPRADLFIDDIYIQVGTQARVELCNNKDYDAATQCEVQTPNNWAEDSISISLNYGSFQESDEAYLFVIDDAGVVSNGYKIKLGRSFAVCGVGETKSCEYSEQLCSGISYCTNGVWGSCQDANEEDSCPVIGGDEVVLQNGLDYVPGAVYDGQTDICVRQATTSNPDWPDSTFETCMMRSSPAERNFYKFDLSLLDPDRTIASAILDITEVNPSTKANGTIELRQVLESWDKATTWNSLNAPGGTLDNPFAQLVIDNKETKSFDITNIVRDWYNNPETNFGFSIEQVIDQASVTIGDENHTDIEARPKLTIIFEAGNCERVPYDFTGDCELQHVDFNDFMQVVAAFRTTNTNYDFNNDNQVNILDLVLHLLNWS